MTMRHRSPDPTRGPVHDKPRPTTAPTPFWRMEDTELERLKRRMLRERLEEATTTELLVALRRAANEAAALAWLEPFPLLAFPELFNEKQVGEKARIERQQLVRARSAELFIQAA